MTPVMLTDYSGYWSWTKVAIVTAVIAVAVIVTVVSGGTAGAVLITATKGALVGGLTSGGIKLADNIIKGNDNLLDGVGDAVIDGALDGAFTGALGATVDAFKITGKAAYSAYGLIGAANYTMNQLIVGEEISLEVALYNGVLSSVGARLDDVIVTGDSLSEGAIIFRKAAKWLLFDFAPSVFSNQKESE